MSTPVTPPFRASTYELEGGRIRLAPLSADEAGRLSSVLATIDPVTVSGSRLSTSGRW